MARLIFTLIFSQYSSLLYSKVPIIFLRMENFLDLVTDFSDEEIAIVLHMEL